MPQLTTVMVADSSDERRRVLGLALYEGGFEIVNAIDATEALMFAAGVIPTLVIVHEKLEGKNPYEIHEELAQTVHRVPPFLVLCDEPQETTEEFQEKSIYHVTCGDLEPERFLHQVRLLLLARELGGELSDGIDMLYGDLTRVSIGDLLRILLKFKISAHVDLSIGKNVGIWMEEGEVIDAHWGKVVGRKAFNRIAGHRGGSFTLKLEKPWVERSIEVDLATLVTDAVEEKLQIDELFRGLPPLTSRIELRMADSFFDLEFPPPEREALSHVQESKSFADFIDRAPATDLEVLKFVVRMRDQGILVLHEPEHRIHVVTDSVCDLMPAVARRNNITVVPMSVVFGQRVYKDGIDLQPDQFYSMLTSANVMPATSPPSKGDFLEIYRRLIGNGDIISVHISQRQSLTVKHATEAAEEGAEDFSRLRSEGVAEGEPVIRVVDSWVNSEGLGMLAVFASRMARRGLAIDDIVHRLETLRERLHFLFVVDTLKYLQKGGRIGKAQALLGTLLGIKPILGMSDGEVVPVDKVRGGRNVQPRMIELFKQRVDPGKPLFCALAHASAPKWIGRLKDLLHESFEIIEMLEGEIGPIVGSHTGPGCVGCILLQPADDDEAALLGPET